MKDFLRKLVEGHGISPSQVCQQSFTENFADAANVEWFRADGYYEAIFYWHNLEHIALFGLNGMLMEYSKKLPAEYLPEPIRDLALSRGEIMNSVMRNRGNLLEYELIVRETPCLRYLLVISDVGELKTERIL